MVDSNLSLSKISQIVDEFKLKLKNDALISSISNLSTLVNFGGS